MGILDDMDQPSTILKSGTLIRTHAKLGDTKGLLIFGDNLKARRPDADGKITGVVGGHGGDVYWVQHGEETLVAAYCFDEFELA